MGALTYRNEPDKTKHSFKGTALQFNFAGTEVQGWRLNMEDAHLAITNFDKDPKAALFGVFDGHGGTSKLYSCIGPAVSEFAKRRFPGLLLKNSNYIAGDYEKALFETFLKIDEILSTEDGKEEIKSIHAEIKKKEQNANVPKSPIPMDSILGEESPEGEGCTANVILFKKGFIYIANAGDSRSVLAKNEIATDLSVDHKPEDEKERTRILNAGGTITNGRVDGNLNLSRSLGDLQYKKNPSLKPEEQKITAAPEIKKIEFEKDFDFIVMGCDGIYDTLTSQQIVDTFYTEFKKNPRKKLMMMVEDFVDSLISVDLTQTEGKGCDNMTCILIKFNK
jgi:serine/threonine protein phosphatase PrpC